MDRTFMEEMRGCNARPQAFLDQGIWEAFNIETSFSHNNPHVSSHIHVHTLQPNSQFSHSTPKCTHMIAHTYKEAHTLPQACRHSGIIALRAVSAPREHSELPSSLRRALAFLDGMNQVWMMKSVEETF